MNGETELQLPPGSEGNKLHPENAINLTGSNESKTGIKETATFPGTADESNEPDAGFRIENLPEKTDGAMKLAKELHKELLKKLGEEPIEFEKFKSEIIRGDVLSVEECIRITALKDMFTKLENTPSAEFGVGKYTTLMSVMMFVRKSSTRTIEWYRTEIESALREYDSGDLHCNERDVIKELDALDGTSIRQYGHQPSPEYEIRISKDGKSGLLIIFNEFVKERIGTEKDARNLETLFKGSGFHVMLFENKRKIDILELLHGGEIKKRILENDYSQVFFAIMSHGKEGKIYTCGPNEQRTDDEIITVEDIIESFKGEQLAGKPKVFLIQACRGKETHPVVTLQLPGRHGKQVSHDCVGPDHSAKPVMMKIPEGADILICHSQVYGYASTREHKEGSLFIQALCDVFKQNICHHHVLDMMTMVSKKVADKVNEDDDPVSCQIPCQLSTLTKRLFLCRPDIDNTKP